MSSDRDKTSTSNTSSNEASGIHPDLHTQVHFLASILEMVSDLVWSVSVDDQKILYRNRAATEACEKLKGESSCHWIDCIHPDDRDVVQKNLDQIRDLQKFSQKFRIVRPDGVTSWLQGRFHLVTNPQNKLATIGISAKDISKRVHVERRLVETRAFYNSLVENLPINVFHKDLDGRVVFANQNYCRELNIPLEELKGKTDYDLFPEMAEKYLRDDRWVYRTGLPFQDVESHPTAENEMIYVEVLKAAVTDEKGKAIGIIGMFWDVTDRKKAEHALRDAKEMAESASRAKTDFLANVSHEIRTPMNGIVGIANVLMDLHPPKKEREYLEIIQSSSKSLMELINDILDYSKIEAGKIELESYRFQLRETLGDIMRSLSVRAHAKQLELIVSCSPEIPNEVVGDSIRLRQVIVNLVNNAIKFTKTGQVELSIQCPKSRNGVAQINFSIIDSGIGISEENLERIFVEFEQADSSTTREYGGTGLGLAIASKLVSMMGGHLKVESELGVGSKFFFTADFDFNDTEVDEPVPAGLAGKHAMIVVKNQKMRENIAATLQNFKMIPQQCSDAHSAIEMLKRSSDSGIPVSVVIADANLDVNDGSVLVGMLRSTAEIKDTPAILLSTAMVTKLAIDDSDLRISDFLIKPVKERDLLKSISRALGLQDSNTTEHGSKKQAAASNDFKPLQILLAEDNLVNQKLALALLQNQGHTVDIAVNGEEAIAMYQQGRYDLVLMDVQMPKVDGLMATREIRQLQMASLQRVPIVALTAHASPADRQKCLAAGMDEYLSKPLDQEKLFEIIEQQLGHRSTITSVKAASNDAAPGFVDWERAFETVGNDRRLLKRLIGVFLKDHPKMFSDIESAVERNDHNGLRLAANTFSSALNHLGARVSGRIAVELESMGEKGDLKNINKLMEDFKESLSDFVSELSRFTKGEG